MINQLVGFLSGDFGLVICIYLTRDYVAFNLFYSVFNMFIYFFIILNISMTVKNDSFVLLRLI